MSKSSAEQTGEKSVEKVSLEGQVIVEETPVGVISDPPDGGLEAWLSIIGGWLVVFVTFGTNTSFGVFQDYYGSVGSSTSSNISWIGSIQLFLGYAVGLIAGRLVDAGYFHYVSVVGTFTFCFSYFMLSLANPHRYYELILAQGIGMGIGTGMLLTPALTIQTHHWKKSQARALGIIQTGSSIGGIIYPIMLNKLFNGRVGFAWGVRAAAFLSLGLLVIAACIMRARLPETHKVEKAARPSLKKMLLDVPYMLAVLGLYLVLWGIFFPYFYLQVWTESHGLSDSLAFYTVAILNAGTLPGRVIPNILADWFGIFNMLCPICLICGALIFAMFGATNPAGVVIFTLLYGAFTGGCLSLLPATMASLADGPSDTGTRMGFANVAFGIASLTGTPIDGALLGSQDYWYKTLVFSGVIMLGGTATLTIARQILAKRTGSNIV